LKRRYNPNKKRGQKLESLGELTTGEYLKMIGVSLQAGALVAGFVDLGFALLPKDLGLPSMIASIVRSIATLFADDKTKMDALAKQQHNLLTQEANALAGDIREKYFYTGLDCQQCLERKCEIEAHVIPRAASIPQPRVVEGREGLGFDQDSDQDDLDDDDLTIMQQIYKWLRDFKIAIVGIWMQYRYRITLVAFASILGMVIYLAVHKRHLLKSLLQRDYVKEMEAMESKGKTKGRALGRNMKRTHHNRGQVKKKVVHNKKQNKYTIYDNDNITDLIRDDEYVSPSSYFGAPLPNGHYIIVRDINGFMEEEEVWVGIEPDQEAILVGDGEISVAMYCPNCAHCYFLTKQNDGTDYAQHVKNCCVFCMTPTNLPEHPSICTERHFMPKLNQETLDPKKKYVVEGGVTYEVIREVSSPGMNQREIKPITVSPVVEESLNPAQPKFVTSVASQCIGYFLDQDKKPVQNGFIVRSGVFCNAHSYDRVRHFCYQGKCFELPLGTDGKAKRVKTPSPLHDDLVLIARFDGLPPGLTGRQTALPEVGMPLQVLSALHGSQAPGKVTKTTALELEIDASTEPGDCMAPYVNVNGKVIGVHMAGSKTDRVANRGIVFTQAAIQAMGLNADAPTLN